MTAEQAPRVNSEAKLPTDMEIAIKTLNGINHLVINPLRLAVPNLKIEDENFTLSDNEDGTWKIKPRTFTESGHLYSAELTYSKPVESLDRGENALERKAMFFINRFEYGQPIISSSSELYDINDANRFLHDRIQGLFQSLKEERPELRPDENPMA